MPLPWIRVILKCRIAALGEIHTVPESIARFEAGIPPEVLENGTIGCIAALPHAAVPKIEDDAGRMFTLEALLVIGTLPELPY